MTNHHLPTSPRPSDHVGGELNRRNLIKTTATIGAAATIVATAPRGSSVNQVAYAQEVGGTRARSWSEADNINTDIKLDGDGWISLQTEFPFWALGFAWDKGVGTWPAVQFAVSYDGSMWDEGYAMIAHDDGGPAPADDRVHTDLFFGDGQEFIRYRTIDGEGNLVVLDRFQVTYIDPTDGPWEPDRGMTLMRTSAANTDTIKPPAIITRAQWGANESLRNNSTGEIWPPEYATVEHAIVHHAAVNYGSDGYNAVRSIYYYHCVTQGWGDIGYNYVVDVNGNIFEGRVGGANVIGGHAYQYAIGSSGICVMGDFSSADPPQAAKSALANIIAYVVRDLNPNGSKPFHEVPNLPTIAAHRDVVQSTCPGSGLYDDMAWLRATVTSILDKGLLDSQMPAGIVPGDWVKIQTDDGAGLPLRAQPGSAQLIIDSIPSGNRVEVERGPVTDSEFNWYLVLYSNKQGWVPADFLVVDPPTEDPMEGYSFGQNILLGTSVPIKSSPSINATTVTTQSGIWGYLLAGPYTAGGTRWFQVYTQYGNPGWITINQFTLEVVTAPASAYPLGTTVRTLAAAPILVRPGLGQTALANVGPGTSLTISVNPVGTAGRTWYGVYGGTGIGGGWIDSALIGVAPQPVSAVGQNYTVIVSMNFRSGAGTGASVIGTLAAGSTGTVIGGPINSGGYRWWNLRTSSGSTGWAAANWLVTTSGTSTPPPPPTDPPPPTGGKFAIGDSVRVTESLNMRSGPGTGNGVVTVLAVGTIGTVLQGPTSGSGYTWWRIQTGSGTGWVVENWLVKQGGTTTPPPTPTPTDPPPPTGGTFAIGDTVRVTESLNMRSGPSTGNGVIRTLPVGTTGKVLEGPTSGSGYTWWRIETSIGTGWVVENWIVKTGGTTTPPPPASGKFAIGDAVRVTESLNLRSSASTGGGVITVLPAGTTGTVLEGPATGSGYTWWRIQTSLGTGWAAQDWLTK